MDTNSLAALLMAVSYLVLGVCHSLEAIRHIFHM